MSANPDRVKEPSSVPSIIVLILLILTVVSLGVAIFINLSDQAEDGRYRSLGGELRVSIQKVFSGARLAVEGDEAAFDDLVSAQKDFALTMRKLGRGDQDTSPIRQWLPGEYKSLDDTWQDVSASIDTISANQERILFLHEVAETLNESIPELQQEYNLVVDILVDSGAKSDQAVLAQRQALLGERITRNIGKMLEGGIDASGAADQFNLDASLFGSVLEGMISGNAAMRIDQVTDEEALESLAQIEELYAFVNNSVDKIFQASPDLLNTRQSVDLILDSSEQLNAEIDTLIANVDDVSAQRLMKEIYIYGIAAFAVFLMVILAVLASVNARRRLQIEEQTNENSQRAILTLLDELADLADGDLRTKATVTEEFTGAIADSINFTIDQLRILVSRITDSSLSISSASELAKSTSEELSGAADQQAKEITEATLSINEMAETIDGVSTQAAESANVANRSVDIAKNGANVVRNTIGGMDTIREQIQDTSKRIKRLGESSQEIGDIVSLINDIADQTNILSLNAAIQASMAGDAGRGFAVVADEVQRLAERSSGATKQIEALVKTIQTDTNEAVISMEQTTTEVVRGARLAQDAGVALEEIETVSSDIADLIQNISESARQQALKATVVSDRMNVIQDITSQTATGTKDTADSIGNLTSLSVAMRESVSGFSLPEELIDDDVEADLSEDAIESADLVEGDQLDPYDTVSDLGAFVDTNDSLDETVIEPVAEIVESSEFDSLDETIQIDSADGLALPEEDEVVEITDEVVDITDEVSESLDMSDEPNELDDVFDVDTALESEPEAEKIVESVTQEEASIDLEEDSIDLDFSFDDDDSFDIETEEPVEESVQAKVEEALQEVTNNDDAEADEFMLGLDEDFDLDLDDFSFDDEPQKNI